MAIAKRRKKFFNVEIPIIEKETQLQAYEIQELDGRYIRYDLTRLLRGKSIELLLKIKIHDNKPVTELRSVELMSYFLRRMMRKGTNYVEDSFSTDCKDARIRIKPFLITRRKVSRAVRKALREKAKEELINYSKDKKTEQLFEDVLKNKLQKVLSLKLKKVYPLSLCEIRIMKIEKYFDNAEKQEKSEETKISEVKEVKISEKEKTEKKTKKKKAEEESKNTAD